MKRKFLKRSSKDFQKYFQKAFTNCRKHDIINISNETKNLKERRD